MKNYILKRIVRSILIFVNAGIFFALSILHFYWAFGGKLWYDLVLPTSSNGLHKFNPGKAATLIVAFSLLCLILITVGNKGFFDRYIRRKYFHYGTLAIAVVFLIRAIGDFKFVGFFKTVKWTKFGISDTQIYSPLCLFIALSSGLIFIFNKTPGAKI
ncbi:MAG: DUF3995 domain-containing protein [Chitinophagaceae bacterium]|nr:DUF3995 domain-containing protein [Chitinophagaceae bacterium]